MIEKNELMSWTNFHSHSHYCDGADAPESYILKAIQQGFYVWGLSSHAPVSFPCKWTMKHDQLSIYHNEINTLKRTYGEKIQIYTGLEVDFIPGVSSCTSFREDEFTYDFLIGSVHFVDHFPDGTPWEIDGRHEVFLKGLNQIFDGNIQAAVERYYELIREMVVADSPDVIGHLDKIRIQNEGGALFTGEEAWYKEVVMATLEVIKDHHKIVEVNTRGIYKGIVKSPYPETWILEQMYQMNIPITLNSDAHHPREIKGAFPETAQMLREIGFSELQVLFNNEWQPFQFDRWGVRVGKEDGIKV